MKGFAVVAVYLVAVLGAIAGASAKTVEECVGERAMALKASVVPPVVAAMVQEIEAKHPYVHGQGFAAHSADIQATYSSLHRGFCWNYLRSIQGIVSNFDNDGCTDILDEQDSEGKVALANPVLASFIKASNACLAI